MTPPYFPLPSTDAVMPPAPFQPKPSIVDRIVARLFPATQTLGPGLGPNVAAQARTQLAANLLYAGGASPQQRGTLSNIGAAIGGVDVNALTAHALAVQQYKQQQAAEAAIRGVTSQPGTPGQSPYQQIAELLPRLTALGPAGIKAAAQLAQVADALKAPRVGNAQVVSGIVDTRLGSPTVGQVGDYIIHYPGEPKADWEFVKGKPDKEGQLTPFQRNNLQQKAEFGAAALAAWRPLDQLRRNNPGVEEEVGKILSSPAFAQAVPGFRSSADAVAAIAKAGGSKAAQQYMRASWSFLDNVLRTRYATGRLGGPMLAQMAQEFLPSLDPEGNSQVHQNQLQAILSAQGESGYDLDPQIWRNATKRHGVSDIDLENILSGGSGNNRLDEIRNKDRY